MMFLGLCVALALAGLVGSILGGYYFGGVYGMMAGMLSGLPGLMCVVMILGKSKNKGFIKLFRDLKDKDGMYEKYVFFPNSFGRIRILIGEVTHPGRIHIKKLGDFDDKGDEFAFGNDRMSWGLPHVGMTLALDKALYTNKLEQDDGIFDYNSAVMKFLGKLKHNEFKLRFRTNIKPDAESINKELRAVIEEPNPEDKLEHKVLGETVGFKNFVNWLLYAFNPVFMDGAIMQEKIQERKTAMDYVDPEKAWTGKGKFIIYVLFGVMVFLLVIGVMWDKIGPVFGGLFGG